MASDLKDGQIYSAKVIAIIDGTQSRGASAQTLSGVKIKSGGLIVHYDGHCPMLAIVCVVDYSTIDALTVPFSVVLSQDSIRDTTSTFYGATF